MQGGCHEFRDSVTVEKLLIVFSKMNYEELYNNLHGNRPNGWLVLYFGNGVYLWPENLSLIEDSNVDEDEILQKYAILFEFHVTDAGSARLLARAKFRATPADYAALDKRWNGWWITACECGTKNPQNSPTTRSVAKWNIEIQNFQDINIIANQIRLFLANQPPSLACFIKRLGSNQLTTKI